MRRCIFLFFALFHAGFASAAGCDLGSAWTKDRKVDVKIRLASAACNAGKEPDAKGLFTGDAVAAKIEPGPQAEIISIDLKRADGLAAVSPPGIRKLSDGTYFTNLEFAAAGDWVISLTLRRGRQDEQVTVTVPVQLNARQAAAAVANATKVPAFSLQDMKGKTVSLADLKGKVWVANFFFASCPEVCPLMARHLADLQRTFKERQDFRIVSVSTDPEVDSQAVLQDFAKRNGADPDRWIFLRGKKAAVVALSSGGLSLDVTAESTMHSMKFALVDRDGTVRARFDSAKLEEREQLKQAIKDLL